jgi:putative tryptophan/tyrosine transport system substrate-binding protein
MLSIECFTRRSLQAPNQKMKRLVFIRLVVVGVFLASAFDVNAQTPEQVRRIGVLMNGVAVNSTAQSYLTTFVQTLGSLGWFEGQNLRIDYRWNAGDPPLARTYATDLISLTPSVILSSSTTNLAALQRVTRTIPIVFVEVSDPLAQGFIPSLAHPGGNITGFTAFRLSMGGQWIELLREIAPTVARVLLIFNPETSPQSRIFSQSIEAAAASLAVEVNQVSVRDTADIESAIEHFSRQPNGGLIVPSDTFTQMRRGLIVELAARHKVPAIYANPDFVRNGGLMYYGFDFVEQFRQAASYVDRILKGANPGDLPVQQPTKFALVINLKTAKALRLEVRSSLLSRADEVIE